MEHIITDKELEDVVYAVAFHREVGGYDQHSIGGKFCRCSACRLVRTYDVLLTAKKHNIKLQEKLDTHHLVFLGSGWQICEACIY